MNLQPLLCNTSTLTYTVCMYICQTRSVAWLPPVAYRPGDGDQDGMTRFRSVLYPMSSFYFHLENSDSDENQNEDRPFFTFAPLNIRNKLSRHDKQRYLLVRCNCVCTTRLGLLYCTIRIGEYWDILVIYSTVVLKLLFCLCESWNVFLQSVEFRNFPTGFCPYVKGASSPLEINPSPPTAVFYWCQRCQ